MSIRKKPAYLLHKSSGQARVRIGSKDHYLGVYGSAESRERYDDLVREWFAKQGNTAAYDLKVADLFLLYLEHAQKHYRKDGVETSELNCIRQATRPLIRLFGPTRARAFGPKALKAVRQELIAAGVVRSSINIHMGRIRRMFKWAVAEELLPSDLLTALQAVQGLQAGRTDAVESEPVKPVAQIRVDAVRPFVSRQVWAMIQLQILTGARPGEIVSMRGCELNMTGKVWEYAPRSHKTSHRGKRRVICIGPKAQGVIRPFLTLDLESYLFSPRDARAEFVATNYRAGSKAAAQGGRFPKAHYTVESYETAIRRACEKAFEMPDELRRIDPKLPTATRTALSKRASTWRKRNCWHPHQLRHNAATEIRRQFGIEFARIVLGHASAVTTEIYAEEDTAKAREIIGLVG